MRGYFIRALALAYVAFCLAGETRAQEIGLPAMDSVGPKLPISSFNGSYTYNVPIEVPDFHGIEPTLSLSYDSSRGLRSRPGTGGWLGVGWSLEGISVIERVSGTALGATASGGRGSGAYGLSGTPADRFTLDGDELVPCPAGVTNGACTNASLGANELRYTGRVQNFLRIRYDQSANDWFVHGRDGTRYEYLSAAASNTFRWYLSRVVDRKGNYAEYTYTCTAGQECLLSTITFNNQGTTGSPVMTANFYYEARPETLSVATGQGLITNPVRLKTIRMLMATTPMWTYRLGYDVSPATSLSQLAYIQEYGRDATFDGSWTVTGGSALPATTFIYSTLNLTAPYSQSTLSLPLLTDPAGDVNGDGRSDLGRIESVTQGSTRTCKLWKGTSTGTSFTPLVIASVSSTGSDTLCGNALARYMIPAVDFTGDGAADFLKLSQTVSTQGSGGSTVYGVPTLTIIDGDGTTVGSVTSGTSSGSMQPFDGGIFAYGDFNGDGKSDFITGSRRVWLATGTSFTGSPTSGNPWNIPSISSSDSTPIDIGDLNGDGKSDPFFGKVVGSNWQVTPYLSTGATFLARTPIVVTNDQNWNFTRILYGDVNGDGRTDLIRVRRVSGTAYAVAVFFSNGLDLVAPGSEQQITGLPHTSVEGARLADINGDDRIDLLLPVDSNPPFNFRAYLSAGETFTAVPNLTIAHINTTGDYDGDGLADFTADGNEDILVSVAQYPPGLLTNVVEPLGGKIAIAYETSVAKPNQKLPFVLPIVKSVTLDDGRGGIGAPVWSSQTTFAYTAGLWNAAERQFFGFLTVAAQLPAIQGETTGPKQVTTFVQTLPCLGKALQIDTFNGAGTLLRSVVNTYSAAGSADSGLLCNNLTTTTNDILSGQTKSAKVERTFDIYGNQLTLKTIGELASSGDDRFDQWTFFDDPADYIVGCTRVDEAFFGLSATAANVMRRIGYAREGYVAASGDASVTSCLVTGTSTWISSTASDAITSATYDNVGNRLTETDAVGGQTQYIYDASKLFVVERRLPKYFGTGADTRFKELTSWLAACEKPAQALRAAAPRKRPARDPPHTHFRQRSEARALVVSISAAACARSAAR